MSNLVPLLACSATIVAQSSVAAQTCSERIAQPSYGIGIDMNGKVWVPQHVSGILRKYSPDGSLPGPNTFDIQMSYYRGVAVTPVDNDVWVGGSRRNNAFDLVDGDTGAIHETFDVGVGGHGGIIACNDVLWSVSKTGLPGVFGYDTNQNITASVCCAPDILADSNNDLEINEQDQLAETVSPGFIAYINNDDENLNGTSDMDESPVGYENDLADVQLFAGCSPDYPLAWWSLSWPNPAPNPDPIKIWLFSDKSDGELQPGEQGYPVLAVAGTPMVRDDAFNHNQAAEYTWPPPTSVWVESVEPYDDLDLTFTINPGPNRSTQSQTVKFSGKPPYTIKLRAVVMVEPGADLDNPRDYTGGCKLSRTEVVALMQPLIDYGDRIAPGTRYDWDPNAPEAVIRLESECWKLEPAPFPANFSVCPLNFTDGNPRMASGEYYHRFVVNHDGTTDAQLQCPSSLHSPGEACYDMDQDSPIESPSPLLYCDGYEYEPCALNVYFIGHAAASWGVTLKPPGTPWPPTPPLSPFLLPDFPFILISDGAGENARDPANCLFQSFRRVFEHEIGCHDLPRRADSPDPPTGTCPNDLCMEGYIIESCLDLENMGSPPIPAVTIDKIPIPVQFDTVLVNGPACYDGPYS